MDLLRGGAFGVAISLIWVVTRRSCRSASFDPFKSPLRPPGWVFGIVWPLLFVTAGASWVLAYHTTISCALYATFLCCLRLPLYTCLRHYRAATVAVATLVLATYVWKWFTLPLVLWLSFATYLNVYRVLSR